MMDYILYKNLDAKYLTLPDLIPAKDEKDDTPEVVVDDKDTMHCRQQRGWCFQRRKEKTTIYYVTDEVQQSQYINMFKAEGMDAVILKHNVDATFITQLEREKDTITFKRIDSDITDTLKEGHSPMIWKEKVPLICEHINKR